MSFDTEAIHIWDFFTLIDDTHHDLFTMYGWESRDTQVESFIIDDCRESSILWDTGFIDLQIGHDLEPSDHLRVQKCLILEYLSQYSVETIAETDYIGQRLYMYIRAPRLDCSHDDEITDLGDIFSLIYILLESIDRSCHRYARVI
jgi:hypothetical protein